jgi:TusA-related sulfurtransferase
MSVDHVIDARALRCPLPVLQLAKAMRARPPGTRLQVLLNDAQALDEVCAFITLKGATLDKRVVLDQAFGQGWLLEIVL